MHAMTIVTITLGSDVAPQINGRLLMIATVATNGIGTIMTGIGNIVGNKWGQSLPTCRPTGLKKKERTARWNI